MTEFVIYGEPCSKANSRRWVGKGRIIKSAKALNYVEVFKSQCPRLCPLIEDHVCVEIVIYYASLRPDLDESLILDCMQGYIYKNDRQVKHKIIRHGGKDKEYPRAEIKVTPTEWSP